MGTQATSDALQIGRRKRAGLPPWLQGVLVALLAGAAFLTITGVIYWRAQSALIAEIHAGLLRTAAIALRSVDPEKHKNFTKPEDENTPDYQAAIHPFLDVIAADPEVAYVYSAVLRDNKVYFVLDGTPPPPPGEKDNTVAVMQEYTEPPQDLLAALRDAHPTVSAPYTDQWGTFISAYQPFHGADGKLVGVVGIDLKLTNYLRRLAPIQQSSLIAAAIGVALAILMGVAVWINRRTDRTARELARRLRTVNALLTVSRALGSGVELRDLLPVIVRQTTEVMGAERAALYLRDAATGRMVRSYADRPSDAVAVPTDCSASGIIGRVARKGKLANVADAKADPDFDPKVDNQSGGELRNLLALPIHDSDEGRLLGVMSVSNRHEGGPFDQDDEILLDALSAQIVVALDRARLVQVHVEKQKLDETLRLAASIQMNMLPHDFSGRGLQRLDLHAALVPAKEVGGDFYDFFWTPDGRLIFLVADVSGKGMPAALFMAKAKTLIKAHASLVGAPEAILARANEELSVNNDDGMFVTVFLASLDVATGHVRYGNAGHNPPYRLAADGKATRMGVPRSVAIGLMEGMPYHGDELQLAPGEALFLYTDGINEAMNPRDELFEYSRMEAILAKGVRSAREIDDDMLKAVRMHAQGAEQSDDITALTVRWRGPE